jgi:hypothetical protein
MDKTKSFSRPGGTSPIENRFPALKCRAIFTVSRGDNQTDASGTGMSG